MVKVEVNDGEINDTNDESEVGNRSSATSGVYSTQTTDINVCMNGPVIVHNFLSQSSSEGSTVGGHGHTEKRHICEICGKGFPYLSILESHRRCHTGEKPFDCHFCDKKFAQKATLQVHERTHTGERPYKCKYCEKTFAQYGTKTVHEKSAHLGIRNYKCPKCNKCLSSPSALYTHKKTHGEKAFSCSFCSKTFTLKNYLKLHVKQVHEQSERKHICRFCSKSFAYAGSLQVHVRTHTGERPYLCRYCPKAFASQGNLQSHERTHTGERPYTCKQCGRSFIQKSQLTAHEATHQYSRGSTPDTMQRRSNDFVCKYCGKRYAYASSLYVHTRLHTGERPFRCSFCDKAFTNQGNMQVHQRVHTGEKPYKCNVCEKSYAQKVGLKIHQEQCQQVLSAKTSSVEGNIEEGSMLDVMIPKLTDTVERRTITALQNRISSTATTSPQVKTSSSVVDVELSTTPSLTAYDVSDSVRTFNKGFVEYSSVSMVPTSSSPSLSPSVLNSHSSSSSIFSEHQNSAFRMLFYDTYKKSLFDSTSSNASTSQPLSVLRRMFDVSDLSNALIAQSFLIRNQHLQSVLHIQPDQWCNLLIQSTFPHLSSHQFPNISNSPVETSISNVVQAGFVPPSVKQEPSIA